MSEGKTQTPNHFGRPRHERVAERARADIERLQRLTRRGVLGIARNAILGFNNHNDLLWASALTYTLALSLVPVLAVALSTLKALGGFDEIKPLITQYVAFSSPEIANRILSFVGKINARGLGAVGAASLLVTVVLTLGTVEGSLNNIFNVSQERTWIRKFTDYLSVTFTMPLLIAAAVSLKTGLQAYIPNLPGIGWMVAVLPIWAGFSFLYLFFPNTHVRWRSAALGGLIAAIALEIGQWAYIHFQVETGKYQAIYGALAAVPMLLGWIYLAWIIVLGGAEISAASQGIESSFTIDHRSPGFVRTAALLTVFRAGERMISHEERPCSVDSLAAELGVPVGAMVPLLEQLERARVIVQVKDESRRQGLYLARDSSAISLAEVLGALNNAAVLSGDERIASVLKGLNAVEQEALSSLTVKDLLTGNFGPLTGGEATLHGSGSLSQQSKGAGGE